MGYDTKFEGSFQFDKPLTVAHKAYLEAFANTRRVKRNAKLTELREDPLRIAVGLPVGVEGEYFVNENGYGGQDPGTDVVNSGNPPGTQPSLWCQWIPSEDGTEIEWDGGEKFYNYVEWLEYLIAHFIAPWGYVLNGQVKWIGAERGDTGIIHVIDNKVLALDE